MDRTLLVFLCLTIASVWCKPADNAQLDKVTVNDVAANTVLATGDSQSSTTDKKDDVASVQISGIGISTGAENGNGADQQQTTNAPPFQPPRAGSMFARFIDDIFQIPINVLQNVARLITSPFIQRKVTDPAPPAAVAA